MNIRVNKNSLMGILLTGDTIMLRIWFCLWTMGWALLSAFDKNFIEIHGHLVKMAPMFVISILCIVHAFSLLYGIVTKKYNTILLFLEGILGLFLWGGVGIADLIQFKTLTPSAFAGVTALFLLIRYPTHYPESRGGTYAN